jgi:hypothetical protein
MHRLYRERTANWLSRVILCRFFDCLLMPTLMAHFFARTMVFLLFAGSTALAKDVTIHGFVTVVNSPTNFEIDDYKVTHANTILIDVDTEGAAKPSGPLKPEDIRVGMELEVKGEYDESSGELKAKSVKVFSDDTLIVKRSALMEREPSLAKDGSGWSGEIYADGQRISVVPTTSITFRSNRSERKMSTGKEKGPEALNLNSLESLNLDTFVHYEGTRADDGSIRAQKMEFQHEEIESGEVKLRKHFDPKVKDPDYTALVPGELKMHWKTYKIVPSQEAQQYITRLGESLIPAHQRDMSPDDPLKIPFRFYLIQAKSFNATTYPNGVVIVHSGVFDVLENEAQLAFVLSHEVSHAIERHVWLEHEYHRKELIALRASGAFVPGGLLVTNLLASGIANQYSRSLENQADRVGLEWMLAAGYDIREAPQSWKAVSRKKGDGIPNPFWDSHDNATTRRSYLMAELKNNYSDVDYTRLRKDSDDFHHVVGLVKNLENTKKEK